MLPAKYFLFHPYYLFRFPPQIWRLATSFFITSPGIGLLFDTYFLYTYMCQMEVGNPRFPRKEDLIWYLTFVCGTILVSFVVMIEILPRVFSLFRIAFIVFGCPYGDLPNKTHTFTHTSYICPDSAMLLLLSRFLEMRKIAPALRHSPSFAIRTVLRCRHGGMSYGWLA